MKPGKGKDENLLERKKKDVNYKKEMKMNGGQKNKRVRKEYTRNEKI